MCGQDVWSEQEVWNYGKEPTKVIDYKCEGSFLSFFFQLLPDREAGR